MSASNRIKSSGNVLRSHDSSHFSLAPQPKSVMRPKLWNEEVEEAYRFQIAGYRDEKEYKAIQNVIEVDRWPNNGFVKKLQRRDGTYYYFNKSRECEDKDVRRTKIYAY